MMYKSLGYDEIPTCKCEGSDDLPESFRAGVEVELENLFFIREPELTKWSIVEDGSLKNQGFELLFRKPLAGDQIESALTELSKLLETQKPLVSSRTSIHVHLDVIDLTKEQFINLLKVYTIVEKLLYRVGGYHRYNNNNCLPVGNTMLFVDVMRDLQNNIDKDPDFINVLRRCQKYSGCNLASVIYRLGDNGTGVPLLRGSLEFRMHEGTDNPERIINWIKILFKLKKFAMNTDVTNLTTDFSVMGANRFLHQVFENITPYVIEMSEVDNNQLERDLYEGIRNLQFIVESSRINEVSLDYLKQRNTEFFSGIEPEIEPIDLQEIDFDEE